MDTNETSIETNSPKRTYRILPKQIWVLGFGSLFMDSSSELVHSLLPVFMASVLGTSVFTIGIIEGIAEATASITKVFSGALSDYFKKRKLLIIIGYGLAAVTKPIFPLAKTIWWVFGARFTDRIGKGIRGAPRDALVADIVPPNLRGAAYGLRQALDTVGAFIGPMLAVTFMLWFSGDIKAVLWIAVVPAFISVLLLMFGVHEPETPKSSSAPSNRLKLTDVKNLPLRFWLVVSLGALFTLARFSEAFLILRAQNVGLESSYVPVIMIVMNIFYTAFAYPAGAAADKISARALLVYGLSALVCADIILALAVTSWVTFLGAAFWGLHMALTQGLFSKLVADTSPVELRGTAFGIFNLVSGGALLLASIIAGSLWNAFGPSAAFMTGAIFAFLAAIGLIVYHPKARVSDM